MRVALACLRRSASERATGGRGGEGRSRVNRGARSRALGRRKSERRPKTDPRAISSRTSRRRANARNCAWMKIVALRDARNARRARARRHAVCTIVATKSSNAIPGPGTRARRAERFERRSQTKKPRPATARGNTRVSFSLVRRVRYTLKRVRSIDRTMGSLETERGAHIFPRAAASQQTERTARDRRSARTEDAPRRRVRGRAR